MLNCNELGQGAVDLISDDFFVGDEDVLEDGLVELATDFVACAHVEGMGQAPRSRRIEGSSRMTRKLTPCSSPVASASPTWNSTAQSTKTPPLLEVRVGWVMPVWPSWQNGTHLVDPRLYAKLVNNRDHSAELSINWANEEAANSRDRPLAEYPGWTL